MVSLSWTVPQPGQVQVRTFRGLGPSIRWQAGFEQRWEDGNARPVYWNCLP